MDDSDIDRHPDLIDPAWVRRVARRAKADVRRMHWDALWRKHRSRIVVGLLSTGLTAIIGIAYALGYLPGRLRIAPASPQTEQVTGPAATATSRVHAPVDLEQPFASTPAAGWSDGAQGIVPPVPVQAGPYSAQQVGAAETTVKQVLVAAHLDPAMLFRHDPTAYLGLFSGSDQASSRARFAPGHERESADDVTRIADGHHLLPVAPKVNGTMSAGVDPFGNLVVHTNYVFAYAFADAPAAQIADPLDIVSVQHIEADFVVISDQRYGPADRGLWHDTAKESGFAMNCADSQRGFLAPAFTGTTTLRPDPATSDSYFAANRPVDVPGSCR